MTTCEICNDGKEYRNLSTHMKMKHLEDKDLPKDPELDPDPVPEKGIEQMFGKIMGALEGINSRVTQLEVKAGGKDNSFKKGVKEEDIESADVTRKGVDERISSIVDEILGEDFGIKIEPRQDQPGFLFTVLVPKRLSDIQVSTRPVKGPDGRYMKDEFGNNIEEEYWPGDERSRAISSYQSFDAIKDQCEKVRSYIVSYYQKLSRPIPEFKLRSNG